MSKTEKGSSSASRVKVAFSGDELVAMLREHGTMDAVEVKLAKYKRDEEEEKLEGGVYTKCALEKEGWTRPLGYEEHLNGA